MTTRREILIVLTATVFAPSAHAQQQRIAQRIGYLTTGTQQSPGTLAMQKAFLGGLRDLGYVEGRDVTIDRRFAGGKREQLEVLARELVALKPDVIVATSSLSVQAVRGVTSTIPVVMTGIGNPVASGFVASLARPGGNNTGVSNISVEVSSKYLELLHSAAPKISHVAVLINPVHPNHPAVLKQIQQGAKLIKATVMPFQLASIEDVEKVMGEVVRERADALIVPPDPFFPTVGRRIAEIALKNRLPTMFGGDRSAVEANGLMGYWPNSAETYRRAAGLADKILKGAKPADLPVELPTRFDFVINLRTARALKLDISRELLLRADTVIE